VENEYFYVESTFLESFFLFDKKISSKDCKGSAMSLRDEDGNELIDGHSHSDHS
jgi:hypothetical protein